MKDKILPKNYLLPKQGSAMHTVLIVIIIVVIAILITKIYKGFKSASNAAGQALGNATIAASLNMPVNRVVYIRSEAAKLWQDGVSPKTGWKWLRNYDEAMFIRTINAMALANEVRLLDQLYQENSGERLKDAIDTSFNSTDKAKLNQQWLAIINS